MRHAFFDHLSGIESPIHHLDARAKIIVFFTLILVSVSSQPNSFLLFGLLAMVLISIALWARLPLGHLAQGGSGHSSLSLSCNHLYSFHEERCYWGRIQFRPRGAFHI